MIRVALVPTYRADISLPETYQSDRTAVVPTYQADEIDLTFDEV